MAKKNGSGDPVVQELEEIKKLIMLQLIASGVRANQIATVLGVDKSVISRLVPARSITKRGG